MADINPRHAAALSLVGWYLMLPPLQFVGPGNDPYSLAKDVETLIGIWLDKYQCVATDDPRLKEK